VHQLTVKTTGREEFVDITRRVEETVAASGVRRGICHLYVPHTTCGLTINEHADPDVVRDIKEVLAEMVPENRDYRHIEGNSPAHVKSSLVGVDAMVFIEDGRLALGTWQGIFLCEFDGPRQRKVWVQITRVEYPRD